MSAQSSGTMNDRERGFVDSHRVAKFASIGRDGMPHVVPLGYYDDAGKIIVITKTDSAKVRNIRRDDRVAVLVDDGRRYVMIRGRARLCPERDLKTDCERMTLSYMDPGSVARAVDRILSTPHVSIEVTAERVISSNV